MRRGHYDQSVVQTSARHKNGLIEKNEILHFHYTCQVVLVDKTYFISRNAPLNSETLKSFNSSNPLYIRLFHVTMAAQAIKSIRLCRERKNILEALFYQTTVSISIFSLSGFSEQQIQNDFSSPSSSPPPLQYKTNLTIEAFSCYGVLW